MANKLNGVSLNEILKLFEIAFLLIAIYQNASFFLFKLSY